MPTNPPLLKHTVHVSPPSLAALFRRAREAAPKEFIETIWGTVDQQGAVSIREFRTVEHTADRSSVTPKNPLLGRFGKKDGKLLQLGTVHSHPNEKDTSPSLNDWRDSKKRRELLTGILTIPSNRKGAKSQIEFFAGNALYTKRRV